jgi:hypothetical protein
MAGVALNATIPDSRLPTIFSRPIGPGTTGNVMEIYADL